MVDGFLTAVAGAFFVGEDVVLYCLCRVVAREVEIAYGVINLVEIVFVAVLPRHFLQGFHFRLYVRALVHLGLLDAGVQLRAVAGVRRSCHVLEHLVGVAVVAVCRIHLSEQEAHACLLYPAGVFHRFFKIGGGFFHLAAFYEEIGVCRVVHGAQPFVCQLFRLEPADYVFRLVCPS